MKALLSVLAAICILTLATGAQAEPLAGESSTTHESKQSLLDWRTPPSEVPTVSGMRVVQGLGMCLAVFFLGIFVLKKLRGDTGVCSQRTMRVIERLSIAPKQNLLLVDVDGARVLLAVGPERTELLREYYSEGGISKDFDSEAERVGAHEPLVAVG